MGKCFVGSEWAAGSVGTETGGIWGYCSRGVEGNGEDEMVGCRRWGTEIEEAEVGVGRDSGKKGGVVG